MSLSHISEALTQLVPPEPSSGYRRFHQMMTVLDERHLLQNPDEIVELKALRMTTEETIAIPNCGSYALTDWAKKQLASLLGIQWNRWFQLTTKEEQADEINRRLWRNSARMRLRTSRTALTTNGKTGVLRAIVTPAYSPISDSHLGNALKILLWPLEQEPRILRFEVTDRSVTFIMSIGKPFRPGDDKVVGDVWGGLVVRNSDVGYASLSVTLSLVRLLCLNGMTAPIPDALLLKRTHRGITEDGLIEKLRFSVGDLPGKISRGAGILADARQRAIQDPEAEFVRLLQIAHMPQKLLPELQAAYALEPEETLFGISQAVTRASQKLSAEERFELDRAAGTYLQQNVSAN